MPEFFDDEPMDGEDKEPENFEPDPTTIAFLDQQQAEFGDIEDEFLATYGFKHECHCGEDYAAGRVGEITQCYHNMMQEALTNCARMNVELKEITAIAEALYKELEARLGAENTLPDGEGTGSDGETEKQQDQSVGVSDGGHSTDSEESGPEGDRFRDDGGN